MGLARGLSSAASFCWPGLVLRKGHHQRACCVQAAQGSDAPKFVLGVRGKASRPSWLWGGVSLEVPMGWARRQFQRLVASSKLPLLRVEGAGT